MVITAVLCAVRVSSGPVVARSAVRLVLVLVLVLVLRTLTVVVVPTPGADVGYCPDYGTRERDLAIVLIANSRL